MKPKTYIGEEHPIINFDKNCTACNLCKGTEGRAVGGAGPDNLENVKLIVFSDHPGHYEVEHGYPFYDNDTERANAKRLPKFYSAGAYIRKVLYRNLGIDSWSEVWSTNVTKCNNQNGKDTVTIKDSYIKECVRKWLNNEIATLHEYNTQTPILALGRHTLTAVKYLDSSLGKELGNSLKKQTRQVYYLWGSHPLVFSVNPAAVADAEFRQETERGYYMKNDIKKINSIQKFPPLFGSPQWIFDRDIETIKPFI